MLSIDYIQLVEGQKLGSVPMCNQNTVTSHVKSQDFSFIAAYIRIACSQNEKSFLLLPIQ